ncbi:MAG: hypothetical protein ACREBB_10140 [Nitrosotalea sp.]
MSCTPSYNLSIILNEKLCNVKDSTDHEFNKVGIWLNDINIQTLKESKIRKERCEVCNFKEDSNNKEGHHIAGEKHDHRQITACKSCHRWLSDRQKTWDRRWENNNSSGNLKTAFFLMGLQDVLILKSKKTGDSIYEEIDDSFTEIISELLKRG